MHSKMNKIQAISKRQDFELVIGEENKKWQNICHFSNKDLDSSFFFSNVLLHNLYGLGPSGKAEEGTSPTRRLVGIVL